MTFPAAGPAPSWSSLAEAAADIAALRPHFTGVYLYRLEGDELVLAGYHGRPSPHTRIKVGEGVCGAAVAEGADQVVPDVAVDPRYLACSPQTRSEVVVLVADGDEVVGQIDIDSDELDPFTEGDVALLRTVAPKLVPLFVAGP